MPPKVPFLKDFARCPKILEYTLVIPHNDHIFLRLEFFTVWV